MGVPVYVYDYLGGPGYLTEANFSLAERNNFSGRGFEKKTSDELLKEIKEGYGPAGEWLPLWQKIAAVDYQYASRFDEMYEELMASPELTECRTYYSGIEAERMKFYSDIVSGYISGKECQESKCYYDIKPVFYFQPCRSAVQLRNIHQVLRIIRQKETLSTICRNCIDWFHLVFHRSSIDLHTADLTTARCIAWIKAHHLCIFQKPGFLNLIS